MMQSTISFFGVDRLRRTRRVSPSHIRGRCAQAEKVNSGDGLAVAGIGIAVVFGRNLIILLAQLQPLLI
jgi:hypothetical protein